MFGSNGYCRDDHMKDLGKGKNRISMERDFDLADRSHFANRTLSCHNRSTSTSSCSKKERDVSPSDWIASVLLSLVCGVLFFAVSLFQVVLTVSPRRNRPAHCAADVVKGRPH